MYWDRLLREMVQRVTSHGSEATSHDRVKEAMRRLKRFRRADLEVDILRVSVFP